MSNRQLILSTPSGKAVNVTIADGLDTPHLMVSVDGQRLGSANAEVYPVPAGAPKGVAGMLAATKGRVGLDGESVDRLRSAIESVAAEISARPEVQMRRLIEEREALVREISYAVAEWRDRRADAWESGDEEGTFGAASNETRINAAKAALAAWDAEHPEVVTEISRQRDESAQRAADR